MAKRAAHKANKCKRDDDYGGDAALTGRLAAYGERFLSMFDDADTRPPAPPSRPAAGSGSSASDVETDDRSKRETRADANNSEDGGSGSNSEQGTAPAGPDTLEQLFANGGRRQARGSTAMHTNSGSSGAGKPSRIARGGGPAGGTGGLPDAPQQQQQLEELMRLRAERKRFMSSKAAVITGSGGSGQQGSKQWRPGGTTLGSVSGADSGMSRAEFLQMQREVQMYGASALDRKLKKKFEAEQLARLGARMAARPRVPASIGRGMAQKQAQRDERALQEGIAAGMIQQKGLGKKKRREKSKLLDRGLMEDGGAFRAGMLCVKGAPASRKRKSGGSGGGKRHK